MEALAAKNDNYGYMTGTTICPKSLTPTDTNKAEVEAREKLRLDWHYGSLKARSDIVLTMKPSELTHIRHCKYAYDVWEKLKAVYQSRGPARKATLLKKILFAKMAENEDMSQHIISFVNTVDQLESMNFDIPEDMLTILLLYSIPDTYENFRAAIESRDNLPTLELLQSKLLEEYDARKEKGNADDANKAFNARAPANARSKPTEEKFSKGKPKKGITCNYCRKRGHLSRDCWKRTADNKEKASCINESEQAVYATDKKTQINKESASLTNVQQAWCFDSGATSHMCNEKSKFVNLEPISNLRVELAVNDSTEALGRGTVSVRTENGLKVRIENALYVPSLKNNLFSLAKCMDKGISIESHNGKIRFKNKENEYFMTASRRGNLFYLDLEEEVAEKAKVTNGSSETAKKWHKRYGHLNLNDL